MRGQVERAPSLGWAAALGSLLISQDAFHPPQRLNVRLTEHLRRCERGRLPLRGASSLRDLQSPPRAPVEVLSGAIFLLQLHPREREAVTLLSAEIGSGSGEKGAIHKISFQRGCISAWELGLSMRKSSP